ncbi:MAG: topology modulation protein [Candidatus Sabulitectum sp.]|nr:topology modulation protein [Candidatus Sabulitectum sp.]
MKRILVLGSGGAGKTTFAKLLSKKTGISLIHLDLYFWNSGWVETPRDKWLPVVLELAERPEWIMDGNYSGTIDIRIQYADTVIFLDYGRLTCSLGVLKRVILNWGRVRDDMPEGCPERFNFDFMKWIWNYSSRSKPRIVNALEKAPASVTVHIVKNRRSLRELSRVL